MGYASIAELPHDRSPLFAPPKSYTSGPSNERLRSPFPQVRCPRGRRIRQRSSRCLQNGLDESGAVQRFGEERLRTRRRAALSDAGVVKGGYDDCRYPFIDTVEIALQVQPREVRHVHVDDEAFGYVVTDRIDELARRSI